MKQKRISIQLDEEMATFVEARSKVECRSMSGEILYLLRRGLEFTNAKSGQASELVAYMEGRV
jgi:metal-responsive CopG/Arc/MetJ family transcriptional regulator